MRSVSHCLRRESRFPRGFDAAFARLLWSPVVGEIRETDSSIQQVCDAKMTSVRQLMELLAKTRLAPVS